MLLILRVSDRLGARAWPSCVSYQVSDHELHTGRMLQVFILQASINARTLVTEARLEWYPRLDQRVWRVIHSDLWRLICAKSGTGCTHGQNPD